MRWRYVPEPGPSAEIIPFPRERCQGSLPAAQPATVIPFPAQLGQLEIEIFWRPPPGHPLLEKYARRDTGDGMAPGPDPVTK